MEELVIRSSHSGGTITLSERREGYFRISFDSPAIRFSKTIYGYTDHGALVRMFEQMTAEWQGWAGNKEWTSLESDMALRCMHDGLGHIDLELELQEWSSDDRWNAKAHLVIDAGQLEVTAYHLQQFFS
jgi:hypothetical protein